jgi:hypothetical protein
MKKYAHLRNKARDLRRKGATLTAICARLALSKSTVYYWIKDTPIPRTACQTAQLKRATQANIRKHREQRQRWYHEAYAEAAEILKDPLKRDFVVLYAAEGFKRDRNRVEICNSNPSIVHIAHRHIVELSNSANIQYRLQCHIDNDEGGLKRYWARLLGVRSHHIRIARKSNSGGLSGRKWRSEHGVLSISVGDTRLRCRLQAWMDHIQREWLRN